MELKLPPYGRALTAYRQKNPRPIFNIHLCLGAFAWDYARRKAETIPDRLLCLPPYVDPFLYSYPVKDCGIVILGAHESEMDYVKNVVLALFKYEAKIIVASIDYILPPSPRLTFFKGN